MDIELQSDHGDFVAVVEILPFPRLPAVVVWGVRTFTLHTAGERPAEGALPVYREAFAFVSLTPSPGKPRPSDTPACRACGRSLLDSNAGLADGCPCNSGRGANHGLVSKETCTCKECDPAQSGSSRVRTPVETAAAELMRADAERVYQPVDRAARAVVGAAVAPGIPDTATGPDGQQRGYVVLSAEERAKGFVRPVRTSYVHVGPPGPKGTLRDLTPDEAERYGSGADPFVKFEVYPPEMAPKTGRFWTQADLDAVAKGCGALTTMGRALAETYARDPAFYGATFCVGCKTHLPVGERGEFVWDGTTERVGT